MSEARPAEIATLQGGGMRVCIVAARFNDFVVAPLIAGATEGLRRVGVDDKDVTLLRVPGAFELPAVARRVAASRGYDAVLCLGAVIRGGTPHFEYVAGECARGIAEVAFEAALHQTAVVFGVLTTDDDQQALERADVRKGNKGLDIALAAIETVTVLRSIPGRVILGEGR